MFTKYSYALLMAALIVVAILTLQMGFSTQQVVSAASDGAACVRPAIAASTVRGAFDRQRGLIVARSAAGPTGVDGGLLSLLSSSNSCSN